MLRRTFVSLIALTAAVVITAGPSHAAPAQSDDYAGACAIGVTETSPHAGDTVTVTGDNFPTSPATVPIMIDNPSQQIGTAHIDGSGHFSDPATIPAGTSAGAHTISVACASTGVDSTTDINVLATAESSSSSSATAPLARTGTDTQPLVLAGLGAVAVGTALVLTARRRRANRVAV